MSTAGIGGLPNIEYVDVNPNIDFPACFNSGEEKVAVAWVEFNSRRVAQMEISLSSKYVLATGLNQYRRQIMCQQQSISNAFTYSETYVCKGGKPNPANRGAVDRGSW